MSKIFEPCKEYKVMLPEWNQIKLAIKGKIAIDEYALTDGGNGLFAPSFATYKYIPGREEYDDPQVINDIAAGNEKLREYWGRARYLNATRRTLESADGFIHAKEPEVDIPEILGPLKIRQFSQKVTSALVSTGRCGGLVDTSKGENSYTKADLAKGKGLPKLIFYPEENIIFWRYEDDELVEVRLVEVYEVPKDDTGIEYEEKARVRRLLLVDGLYVCQIFDENGNYESIEPTYKGERLNYIPFQMFGADDNSSDISRAPMFDIASENLGHYSLSADNRANIFMTCNAITVVYTDMTASDMMERNPNGFSVDAGSRNSFGQGDRVELLQANEGNAAAEMERVERRLVMLGAQLITNSSSNQTLGAKRIEANASVSTLRRVSLNASEGITNMLDWASSMIGSPYECSYKLNTEFLDNEMDPQTLQLVMQQVQLGYLPKEALWEANRSAGVTKMDNEDIEESIQDGNVSGGLTEEEARAQAAREAAEEE